MIKKRLTKIGIVLALLLVNVIISLKFEQKDAFASAVKKYRLEKKVVENHLTESHSIQIPLNTYLSPSSKISFNDLREYKFSRRANNPIPDKLKALQGKEVNIAGYMIPMTEALDVTEFMLVQMPFFGCCYSVPPEPNETVMVKFQNGKSTPYVYTPIRVTGVFKVQQTKIDDFVVSVFEIEASKVNEIDASDKEVIQHQVGTPTPNRF